MTITLWCLFIAALLHVFSKTPLFLAMAKQRGGYNNSLPREQQKQLDDYGKRAAAAHYNQLESFPIFAAGALVCTSLGLESYFISALSCTYIISRILYLYLYVKDLASLRTLVWLCGFTSSLVLIASPLWNS
ncbi:MAPEG family protein [Paraferrimonas sp. SM1919]|uniref:MAPEG family protein n=1 Tax=Paraferrimonas sp. SM1919 TaxID=2662263 RepID=UPI0013CF8E38|nr:MAPEG family protein [Paraferrimonas sp. SM1919]